jgi:hypothetical protein
MKIYEGEYLFARVDLENQLVRATWQPETEKMKDAEFRQELSNYLEAVKNYKITKSLVDTTNFNMGVMPETQEWVSQNINLPLAEIGITRFAFLVSKDFFAQVSIEQTMDEGEVSKTIDTQYFDNLDAAEKWLGV